MKKRFLAILASGAILMVMAGAADAALLMRGTDILGNKLIYDTDMDITWYDYTKSADTWDNQVAWADSLEVTFNDATYNDWRLPATVDGSYVYGYSGPDSGSDWGEYVYSYTWGYNLYNSEIGYLFYIELDNNGYIARDGASQSDYGLENTGVFDKLPEMWCWSGTEHADNQAWGFGFFLGYQGADSKTYEAPALAVRPGDVAPVPVPSTIFLLASGIFAMAGDRLRICRRRLRRRRE
jgi:hypothetical protein